MRERNKQPYKKQSPAHDWRDTQNKAKPERGRTNYILLSFVK